MGLRRGDDALEEISSIGGSISRQYKQRAVLPRPATGAVRICRVAR